MEKAQAGLTKWGRLAAFLPLVSLMASCPAVAKTVALWPLCDNKASPSVTGVFAGDSRFDLTVSTVGAVPTVEIGLWKTAFTAGQVRTAMTARPVGTERDLLGYWPMDDAEGDTLRNLKEGGPSARPVGPGEGHFDRARCANLPVLDGDMGLLPPPG